MKSPGNDIRRIVWFVLARTTSFWERGLRFVALVALVAYVADVFVEQSRRAGQGQALPVHFGLNQRYFQANTADFPC